MGIIYFFFFFLQIAKLCIDWLCSLSSLVKLSLARIPDKKKKKTRKEIAHRDAAVRKDRANIMARKVRLGLCRNTGANRGVVVATVVVAATFQAILKAAVNKLKLGKRGA